MRRRTGLAALLAPCLAPAQGSAIRLVVPVAPGGSQDTVARLLARYMAGPLGQSIIVENRSGAAGNIGFEIVARARPDGLTLGAGSDNLSINKALFPLLSFDPVEDLAPIAQATRVPQCLAVRADSPARDLPGFLEMARREPVAVGTGGNGSLAHMLQQLVREQAGVSWTHVPYRGGAPAVNDLVAGQIHAVMGNVGAVAEQIRAGLLRGIAVSSSGSIAALPGVASFAQQGMPAAMVLGWHGVVAPRGTAASTINRLHEAALATIRMPLVVERLAALGIEPDETGAAGLLARMRADAERWAGLVRRGAMRAD